MMIHGRCPFCGTEFDTPTLKEWPPFPFCSDRCRLVDLGRWLDGRYALPDDKGGDGEADEGEREQAGDGDEDE